MESLPKCREITSYARARRGAPAYCIVNMVRVWRDLLFRLLLSLATLAVTSEPRAAWPQPPSSSNGDRDSLEEGASEDVEGMLEPTSSHGTHGPPTSLHEVLGNNDGEVSQEAIQDNRQKSVVSAILQAKIHVDLNEAADEAADEATNEAPHKAPHKAPHEYPDDRGIVTGESQASNVPGAPRSFPHGFSKPERRLSNILL